VKLKELTDLINIRQYVANAIGNPHLDKATINYVNGTLILIDKKIVGILKSDAFKDFIRYDNVKVATQEAVKAGNEAFLKAREVMDVERGIK
jgi:hypothetical protein